MLPIIAERASTASWNGVSLLVILVKVTAILMGAIGVTHVMQRAAAGARHLVWLVALGALLLVPALARWGPLHLAVLPEPGALVTNTTGLSAQQTAADAGLSGVGALSGTVLQPAAEPAAAATAANAADMPGSDAGIIARIRGTDPLTLLFIVWATIALAIAASLAYATFAVHRVVAASRPLNESDWLNVMWEVSDRLGLARAPRLLQSSRVRMPFACGILRPTIVLPIESNEWSSERRLAVLLHELAHVRRRDLLGHTLGRIACAVYWFHPLVWTAARRLRSESERACDDLALTCGTGASDYAEHLLEIVTSVRRDRTPLVALAMARRKEFEGRMLAILDPQLTRSAPTRWKTATIAGSLGVLSILVGAVSPTAREASYQQPVDRSASAVATTAVTRADTVAKTALPAHPVATGKPGPAAAGAQHPVGTVSSAIDTFTSALARSIDATLSSAISSDWLTHVLPSSMQVSDSSSPDERVALLAKILKTDTSTKLRRTAAWGLQRYAHTAAAEVALADALQHDGSARVREMAAWGLERDRNAASPAVQALNSAITGDANSSVRATAAWAVAGMRNSESVAPLTAALADSSAAVRIRAVWAIGQIRPRPAPAALVARLRDTDPRVRRITAWALYTIRDPQTIAPLQQALNTETDQRLQVDYVRALAAMGDSSLDAIRSLLESSNPGVKSMAVNALATGRATGPWPWPWPEPRPFP